ncbi:hypothetical protein [Haloarcula nitratireducens]|uniref:Uncharacterized protein n=1 Tax=Haloarcula nitratireducens TaxID=2487749 RepID=A0AAW4PGR8_9EURY|nr:hypothetical protein [Halomicroarcula nitratireducens]MBX0296427.1 hypothetical protein [Halomicroarcula nitratireducens]
MKAGSGDDPFAEIEEREETTKAEDAADEAAEATAETTGRRTEPLGGDGDDQSDANGDDADDTDGTTAESASPSIPYKFRRSSVKEGRTQRPIFVRPHVEERESDFLRELEDDLGEDVYKTDALEAALVVAMNNPDLVADELREWGYDWD